MSGLAANFQYATGRLDNEPQDAFETVIKVTVGANPSIAIGGVLILALPPRLAAGAKSARSPGDCADAFRSSTPCSIVPGLLDGVI